MRLLLFFLLTIQCSAGSDSFDSPNGHYNLTIFYGVNGSPGDETPNTMVLLSDGSALGRFPTDGYVIDVKWGENFVAINNRISNSGDYLWVIDLRDGMVVKQPIEIAKQFQVDTWNLIAAKLSKQISKFAPEFSGTPVSRFTLTAREWLGPDSLVTETLVTFWQTESRAILEEVWVINGGKMSVTSSLVRVIDP